MKKIDIFENGKYVCSTVQSKTCKEAKDSYIKYVSTPHPHIKHRNIDPKTVKAFFDKNHK